MNTDDPHQESPAEQYDAPHPEPVPEASSLMVVGIGASAGDIRALQGFFAA